MNKILYIASYGRCAEDAKDGPRMVYLRNELGYFYRKERGESLKEYSDKKNYSDPTAFKATIKEILADLDTHPSAMIIVPKGAKQIFLDYFRKISDLKVFDVDAAQGSGFPYRISYGNYEAAAQKKSGLSQFLGKILSFLEGKDENRLEAKGGREHVEPLSRVKDRDRPVIKKFDRANEVVELVRQKKYMLN